MVSVLAIIPARGGSKRIPRKNIKDFLGKPIIAYSIEAATKSQCFDEVMVSTDDEEIATIAKQYGAGVPFIRNQKTSDDHAMLADVIEEVILQYAKFGKRCEYVCCLLATAPFIAASRLQEGFELLKKYGADTVLPVCRFSYPIQRSLKINNNSQIEMFWPENYNVRSQDLEPAYHDVGQFYWIKVSSFLEQKKLFANKTIPLILPESEVQDIDTLEDWEMAELKFNMMKKVNEKSYCAGTTSI